MVVHRARFPPARMHAPGSCPAWPGPAQPVNPALVPTPLSARSLNSREHWRARLLVTLHPLHVTDSAPLTALTCAGAKGPGRQGGGRGWVGRLQGLEGRWRRPCPLGRARLRAACRASLSSASPASPPPTLPPSPPPPRATHDVERAAAPLRAVRRVVGDHHIGQRQEAGGGGGRTGSGREGAPPAAGACASTSTQGDHQALAPVGGGVFVATRSHRKPAPSAPSPLNAPPLTASC